MARRPEQDTVIPVFIGEGPEHNVCIAPERHCWGVAPATVKYSYPCDGDDAKNAGGNYHVFGDGAEPWVLGADNVVLEDEVDHAAYEPERHDESLGEWTTVETNLGRKVRQHECWHIRTDKHHTKRHQPKIDIILTSSRA